MQERKYTQQEITDMADECFKRCYRCENYEPVGMPFDDTEYLFTYVPTGCYYAASLPWEHTKWCVFDPCKNPEKAKILESLKVANICCSR